MSSVTISEAVAALKSIDTETARREIAILEQEIAQIKDAAKNAIAKKLSVIRMLRKFSKSKGDATAKPRGDGEPSPTETKIRLALAKRGALTAQELSQVVGVQLGPITACLGRSTLVKKRADGRYEFVPSKAV